jgi:hypothetical protein
VICIIPVIRIIMCVCVFDVMRLLLYINNYTIGYKNFNNNRMDFFKLHLKKLNYSKKLLLFA